MQLAEELEASELTQKEFADRHQVSLGSFQFWLFKKSRATPVRRSETAGSPRSVVPPVEVVASAAPQIREGLILEVALPRGLLLRFPEGTRAEYLVHLVAVLG